MLQIYVTLWGRWCVCVCVCVCVYLELLSHFLPIKISLTNISPILIKTVDFKNLSWATSFATQASRKFIYLPGQEEKKVIVIPWNSLRIFPHFAWAHENTSVKTHGYRIIKYFRSICRLGALSSPEILQPGAVSVKGLIVDFPPLS